MTRRARGFTLLEVLITMIILAIGMLGLANLQSKIHITEVESYQRAHAVLLLQDMMDRLNANQGNAGAYTVGGTLGTPNSEDDCTDGATYNTLAKRDRCEWQNALLGASEQAGGTSVGAMIGARGCIEQVQAPDPAPGVCTPGIYRISIAWQGLHTTAEPADGLTCGEGQYTNTEGTMTESLRRVISAQVMIGLPRCSS